MTEKKKPGFKPAMRSDLPRGARAINLARKLMPNASFKEFRAGVTRKSIEFSLEQWARIIIAARANSMSPSKFVRIVTQDYLDKHTAMPQFLPGTLAVGSHALAAGSLLSPNNAKAVAAVDPFEGVVQDVIERIEAVR